jgi:hypothetical protein
MAGHYVEANYRFIAAYQEVNVRIAQRQQALALYVTLIASLLAVMVALKSSQNISDFPVEWLAFGFPVASICLVFLQYMSERAIANLRHFLSVLEHLDNADQRLPSYHLNPTWSLAANKARRFHVYAAAVLVAGSNAIGIGTIIKVYPERMAENAFVLWITAIVAVGSVIALLVIPRWAYQPEAQSV